MKEDSIGDMKHVLAQAQRVQSEFKVAQEKFAKETFVGTSGIDDHEAVVVKVVVNGVRKVEEVTVGKGVLELKDTRVVGKLIQDAVNKAMTTLEAAMQTMMMKIYKRSTFMPPRN